MNDTPSIILLAGGDNSRFFPLNTTTHKGCRSIGGKPLVVRALESLQAEGFTDISLVVSPKDYDGKGMSAKLAEYSEVKVKYVLQPEANGQADAILLAARAVQSDTYIVASPYYLNVGELAQQLTSASKTSGADCLFLGSTTDQPQQYGILTVDGSRVTGVTEKPPNPTSTKKINSVYFLRKPFIEYLQKAPSNHYSLEIAFNSYCQDHLVEWIEIAELPSLKFSWQLLDFMKEILLHQSSIIHPTAHISPTAVIDESSGPIIIDEGAHIHDFAKIAGPAYVGKQAVIGEYSYVRQASVEEFVTVGIRTEIARSLLLPHVTIHDGYCADSIIGDYSTISAGLLTANKRLDRGIIMTNISENKYVTNRKALGVIIGEKTNMGINVSTMPGVLVGAGSIIYPSQTLYHSVEPESVIKTVHTK